MNVGAGSGYQHAQRQAGVHILQVLLRGLGSVMHTRVNQLQVKSEGAAGAGRRTYIWEKVNRASRLMLRSNTFMVKPGRKSSKSRLRGSKCEEISDILVINR